MLKPYDGYKETTCDWLEKVPGHWNENRAKNLYKKENREPFQDDEVVTCFRDGQVTLRKNRRTTGFTESIKEHGYQHIDKGDLVIHVMDAFAGAIGVSDSTGKGTPVYSVCTSKTNINNFFYAYIIREMAKTGYVQSLYRGIRERSSDFRFEVLARQSLPTPPREEQDQIVKYLDWQTSKINTLIKAKKKQIELLKEQKQAVINKAVTKGLDDTVPMKDSGIEWLGEVPEHWGVNRLKRFCKVNASISNLAKTYSDNDDLVFLPMENIAVDGKIDCSLKRPFKEIKSGYSSFAKYDVVIAKITPCFENGKGAYLCELETEIGYGTTELITIRAFPNILPKYLYLVTMTQYFRLNGEEQMTGSAGQKRVPTDFVANFVQGIPPLKEQQSIVTYLEEKTALIDKAIAVIEKEIELVSEYKTSLISSVVTGKVDVRDILVPDFEVVEEDILEDDE